MKERIFMISVFLTIVIILCLVYFTPKNKEYFITDNDHLYEVAKEYLDNELNKNITNEKEIEDKHYFISYYGFDITEDENYRYAYMWIAYDECGKIAGEVKELSGASLFYKFRFKGEKVVDYQIPEDGSGYEKSIKELVPDKHLREKILNFNSMLSNDKQIKEYYN